MRTGDIRSDSSLSEMLIRYREAAGFSQEDLANRSALSVRAISDLERGRTRKPHLRSIELLAQALKLDETDTRLLRDAARRNARRQRTAVTVGDPGVAVTAPTAPEREQAGAPIGNPPHRERLDRAARELATAVDRQWSAEVEIRSLRRPEPVRLRWSSTGRPVSATESAILRGTGDAGHPERLRLRGDLTDLSGTFRELPAHQLVVLGQPGAGKTVLAMLLTLALLHGPQPDEPTPVLLTLSSWNPTDQHRHTWIVRKLAEEYPGLTNTRTYGPDAAARLVAEGRVMPVLDGLDEISPSLHAAAIDALDRAAAGGRPLVVTCRSAEYERAVRHSGTLLARAAVVEIEPVTPDDAVTFLTGRQRTGDTRWQPVARHLADHPHGALARALSTPLMVDLARTAYADPGTDPTHLCDTTRFCGPAEIEDHLLDSFLPAVYAHHPPAPGSQPVARPRYPPERAQQWLTFLARYMRHRHTHDLAWWQLACALPRSAKALLFGLPPALLFAITGALAGGPVISLVYGLSFAATGCTVAGLGRPPGPRRVEVRFHGTAGRFAGHFAIGVAIAIGLGIGWSLPYGLIAVLAAVFGGAIGMHVWLDTPTDARTTSSPSVVLDQERVSALSFILAVALSLGLFYGLAFTESKEKAGATALTHMFDLRLAVPAGVAAALLGRFSFGRLGLAYGLAGAVVGGQVIYRAASLPVALAAGSMFALAIGLTLVASRAWGVYLLTRCWLTARGRLPLRLMRFLDDAHRRGVLRNAGAVYQFRHARLQDRLSSQDPAR
jgi:transcriptional regulator with XRE-family HTH domain